MFCEQQVISVSPFWYSRDSKATPFTRVFKILFNTPNARVSYSGFPFALPCVRRQHRISSPPTRKTVLALCKMVNAIPRTEQRRALKNDLVLRSPSAPEFQTFFFNTGIQSPKPVIRNISIKKKDYLSEEWLLNVHLEVAFLQ